jgi:hypothetical protein
MVYPHSGAVLNFWGRGGKANYRNIKNPVDFSEIEVVA